MKQSGDLEAYRLYAQGRRLLDQRTVAPMRQAASYFDQAIERDPGYALAWVGISDALTLLYDYGFESADRVLPRAEKSVRHALELDEGLAEAHASLGLLHSNRREGPASVRELQRAVQLRPGYADAHNWLSWIFQCLGERESALESAKRAVELNPLSQEAVSNLSVSFLGNGDAVMALREARRLREIEPTWSTGAFYEALALIGLCRFEEAKPVLEGISVSWVGPGPLGALALAHAASGDRDRAREMLAEFETGGDTFSAGLVHAALDEVEEAFAAFQRVENWGDYWPTLAVHLYFEDVMSPLRADPRFDEIVRKLRHSWGVEIQNGENPKIPG